MKFLNSDEVIGCAKDTARIVYEPHSQAIFGTWWLIYEKED